MGIAEYVLHSFIVQHTQGSLDRPRPIRWQVLPSSHPGYDPVCVAASHAGDDPAQALSLTVTHPISVLGLMPSKL